MADIFDWSSTASSNVTLDGIGCNTGMSPANTDNLFRSTMAIIRNSFASALKNFLAGTAALPIANGGTAATDAATALSNLGALADDYRDLVRIDKSSGWTLAASERANGIIYNGSAAAVTIPPNSSVAIPTGAAYVILNVGSGALTLTRGSGVEMHANGSSTNANAVLAPYGQVTLIKWTDDYWTAHGSGLS